jgi:hypothetical protein
MEKRKRKENARGGSESQEHGGRRTGITNLRSRRCSG